MSRTKLLTAIGALVVSLALLVGGTYALFTDEAKVTAHLRAGDMKVNLIRTDYQQMLPNDDGFVADVTPNDHDTDVAFTTATNLNMFGLTQSQVFVPGSSVSADLRIVNSTDSDVAFDYWITIVVYGAANPVTLAEYIQIDVTVEGQTGVGVQGKLLYEGYSAANNSFTVGSSAAPIGTLAIGDEQDFTVVITMLETAGNDTKNQEVKFDLIVNATQRVTAPTTTTP